MKYISILFLLFSLVGSITAQSKKMIKGSIDYQTVGKEKLGGKLTKITSSIDLAKETLTLIIAKQESLEKMLVFNTSLTSNSDMRKEGRHIVKLSGKLNGETFTSNGVIENKGGETYFKSVFTVSSSLFPLKQNFEEGVVEISFNLSY